jgi:hypothetical protein
MAKQQHQEPVVLQTVREVLNSSGLEPIMLEEGVGFTTVFSDENLSISGVALVYEEEQRFVFYLEIHPHTPNQALSNVAEFITRVNFGLTIGNFELDYGNGAVRFKCSIDYFGTTLTDALIRNAILAAMDAVEAHYDALIEVMEGYKSPKDAAMEVGAFIGE